MLAEPGVRCGKGLLHNGRGQYFQSCVFMKSFGKARFSWSAVVAGLAVILIVLAVLEYRWSKDVSEAASVRMHASLQSSVMAFRQDLYRELASYLPAVAAHPGG